MTGAFRFTDSPADSLTHPFTDSPFHQALHDRPLTAALLAAGVALLAGASSAPALARIAAVSWLTLVVVVRTVHPWMSILSTLLAVVFPLVLLVYVWTRRKLTAA